MKNRIMSEKQRLLVEHLPEEIRAAFYLTGGTALSAFYLEHRLSEDMDFFTDTEETMPRVEFLTGFLKRLPGSETIAYQRLFDRRIFSVGFKDGDRLKLEFTVYPFEPVEARKQVGRLTVDGLLNILTGKLFAMTDRFDPKDFVDIYFAFKRYALRLPTLVIRTEERFGIGSLSYMISERFLMVKRIKTEDLPLMLAELDLDHLKAFFVEETAALVRSRLRH